MRARVCVCVCVLVDTAPNAVAYCPHSVTNLCFISDGALKCALQPLCPHVHIAVDLSKLATDVSGQHICFIIQRLGSANRILLGEGMLQSRY